jgi:hypothetical protein
MTSTDTPTRPAYTGRRRDWAATGDTAAWDLLMQVGRLTITADSYRADLASWRNAAAELLMTVDPTKRGRHHAPETDDAIASTDGLLSVRGAWLNSRVGRSALTPDWDLSVISFLGQLA